MPEHTNLIGLFKALRRTARTGRALLHSGDKTGMVRTPRQPVRKVRNMTRETAIVVTIALALAGCGKMTLRSPTAVAALAPTQGNTASGTVNFMQKGDVVLVEAVVKGLTPGLHGFHVHERGNCTAGDASSAGGHFNPGGSAHGGPRSGARHAGDLGNLEADASGTARYRAEVTGITLNAGERSIINRSVIVHEKPDDLTTQPAGNSGARLACGLISKSADKWF
jgi:Cu-Zn family superoxide dismutase